MDDSHSYSFVRKHHTTQPDHLTIIRRVPGAVVAGGLAVVSGAGIAASSSAVKMMGGVVIGSLVITM